MSKNTHENHSDPKINQNFFESDCEKIQNLADKESKTSQENHSDSKRTKGQLISKYPFGVIVFTKIATKYCKNFCTEIFEASQGASWKLFGAFWGLSKYYH